MNLSVVICTYNRAEDLRKTLGSLAGLRVPPGFEWELLVVDNNSTDHTRHVVEARQSERSLPVRYIFEGRQGKSFALNTGILEARGAIVAFTDDDVRVDPDWLMVLHNAFEEHRCLGVGGRIVPVWSQPKPSWYSDAGPFRLVAGVLVRYEHGDTVIEAPVLPFGANMALRREAFAKYGMFRTDLGPGHNRVTLGEDTEFWHRLRVGGETILYLPNAVVYHPVEPSRLRRQYFQKWYFQHGRLDVRLGIQAGTGVRVFRIPRHLFRTLFEKVCVWLVTVGSQARFYRKLECIRCLGWMAEFRESDSPPTAR